MIESRNVAGLAPAELQAFVQSVLAEDIGSGDVTTNSTVSEGLLFEAVMAARQPIVIAGIALAKAFFAALDPALEIEPMVNDGTQVEAGTVLMRLRGNARAILAAERSALNTLQHLSGIATLTREYVCAIEGTKCILLDTRKTTPGLRVIEKYAAQAGGAQNHRMRLDDGILIKDNHIAAVGSLEKAVRAVKAASPALQIQVEVDEIEQIEPALACGAERLLLDNMAPALLRHAVELVAGRVPLEASGGVRLDTIAEIARTGVDFVSVGRMTQSAPAVDIGLDYALV